MSESSNVKNQEMTLSDVATILLRRRLWFFVFFGVTVIVALCYALLKEESYSYSSVYQLAELKPGEGLESPDTSVEKVQQIYLPSQKQAFETHLGVNELPFSVSVRSPEKTTLLLMSSVASKSQSENVKALHNKLLGSLSGSQEELYEARLNSYQNQLEMAENNYNELKDKDTRNAAELAIRYLDMISNYEARINDLKKGEIAKLSMRDSEATGPGKFLIIIGGCVIGVMLGVFFALFSEVVARVRDKVANVNAKS